MAGSLLRKFTYTCPRVNIFLPSFKTFFFNLRSKPSVGGQRRDVRRELFPTEGLWDDDDANENKPGEGQSDQELMIEV